MEGEGVRLRWTHVDEGGTALPSGSARAGNNKFRLRGRAETSAALDLRGGSTELTHVWRG